MQDYGRLKFQVLREFWGHSGFREFQEEIIDSVIGGKDTLALLPTGGGKSLCYQLPALLLEGVCLVISPLLALMKQQVKSLRSKGIEAAYLSSELSDLEEDMVYSQVKEGLLKLLYISPERLANSKFILNTPELKFSFLAVDEAHCISEWGQDFRPSYRNIKVFREQFFALPILAVTGTATAKVVHDITEKLGLRSAHTFRKSFARENIQIQVLNISDKYERILHFLRLNISSGLVYTQTRKEAEGLSYFLKSKGLHQVDCFHAGLSLQEKNSRQASWTESKSKTLITTNAFGMGIDKAEVDFVIHLSPPFSLENYYQEIGRGGRGGGKSLAVLLWDEQDLYRRDEVLKNQSLTKKVYEKIYTSLYSMFQIADGEIIHQDFSFDILKLQKRTGVTRAKLMILLNFFHAQELIFLNKNSRKSSLQLLFSYDVIEELPKKESYFLELLQRNIVGFASQSPVYINEAYLSEKLQISPGLLKQQLIEIHEKKYVRYVDGSFSSIKFLKPRNDKILSRKYWKLLALIQGNILRKWEEFKFYIRDTEYCKMKLILHYFGEKNVKDCKKCSVCMRKIYTGLSSDIHLDILSVLKKRPCSLEEICIFMQNPHKEIVLENLTELLNSEKIRMLDYKTYTIV
ncbi:MAG: RecQ family ATP-dependent DNA helicase [Bergeyella sp.]|nr:RecQ family ATP-dependent DNA helicase [Bergeyella sp.]